MADTLTPEERSEIMGRVRSKDTRPELTVRRLVHRLGYRFRLHVKNLPGSPDLVFPARGKVIFVHGCFWHRHEGCRATRSPKSHEVFWQSKFQRNIERDKLVIDKLRADGWEPLVIWECQVKDERGLVKSIESFLGTAK